MFVTDPRLPHIDGVVLRPGETVDEFVDAYQNNLGIMYPEQLPMTEPEFNAATLALSSVSSYMERMFSKKSRIIPLANVRVLTSEGMAKVTDKFEAGYCSPTLGDMMIVRRPSLTDFAATCFHEAWHLSCYSVLQRDNNGDIAPRLSGLRRTSRAGRSRFYSIDEGLTGFMTDIFIDRVLRKTEPYKTELENPKLELTPNREREQTVKIALVDMLWEKLPGKFPDSYSILDMFYEAQIKGNWRPIARIAKQAFKGGLDYLAWATDFVKHSD